MLIPERFLARGPLDPGIYVVATPIGNLGDITLRGLRVLANAEVIWAEDTRRTQQLLSAYGIKARVRALHQHNEEKLAPGVVDDALSTPVALVSDAGTPLLSDPGLPLVRAAIEAGVNLYPIPGPSALLAASVVSGFALDHMQFVGFLPHKGSGRRERLERAERSGGAMVLYEAPSRVTQLVADLLAQCGPDRQILIARELTKLYESHWRGPVSAAADWLMASEDHRRGEFVVVVEAGGGDSMQIDEQRLLSALHKALPPSKAAKVAAEITGKPRRAMFEALERLNPSADS